MCARARTCTCTCVCEGAGGAGSAFAFAVSPPTSLPPPLTRVARGGRKGFRCSLRSPANTPTFVPGAHWAQAWSSTYGTPRGTSRYSPERSSETRRRSTPQPSTAKWSRSRCRCITDGGGVGWPATRTTRLCTRPLRCTPQARQFAARSRASSATAPTHGCSVSSIHIILFCFGVFAVRRCLGVCVPPFALCGPPNRDDARVRNDGVRVYGQQSASLTTAAPHAPPADHTNLSLFNVHGCV